MKQTLITILLLTIGWSCTRDTEPPITNLIEWSGVVDQNLEEKYLIGGSNEKALEAHISISVAYSEILFSSTRYSFDASKSGVSGNMECEQFEYSGYQAYEKEGVHYLEFLPERPFWECLEYDYCAHGDEVFSFVLYLNDEESN